MFEIINLITILILNFCMGFILFKITIQFLIPRSNNRLVCLPMVLLLGGASFIIVYPEEADGTIGILLCFSLAVFIFCRGSFLLRISIMLLLSPIIISIGYLTEDFGFVIWKYIFHENLSPIGSDLLHTATIFLRLLFWYFIYRFTKNRFSQVAKILTPRMWIFIDVISLSSFIGIITVINNTAIQASHISYPACIATIITNLGCCYLCTYIVNSLTANMEIETLKYQQAYYGELEESQQNIRRLRHDMNNHLNVIGTLLKGNKTIEANEYFEGLSGEFSVSPRVFCKNSTINAVLCAKYELAVQNKIDCQFQVDLKDPLPLNAVSLCSLFANTLDNAIESNQKIAVSSYRRISLKTRCQNDYFSYELVNAKVNQITEKHNQFISDKQNPSFHGIGLQNVKNIAENGNGTLNISYTDTEFTITILLPCNT